MRVECVVRPPAGENGLWALLCAAGMSGSQPSAIKTQDPFYGPLMAERMLQAIADYLARQGYIGAVDPPIWRLYLWGGLRRLNDERRPHVGDYLFRPES